MNLQLIKEQILSRMNEAVIIGVRFGEETCSRSLAFVSEDAVKSRINEIKAAGLRAYYVFPDICESDWQRAQQLLELCVLSGIDGIVVNDFGMLMTAKDYLPGKIILGRQFDKRMRDPRTATGWNECAALEQPGIASEEYEKLINREKLLAAELECFGSIKDIPAFWQIWVHTPYLLLAHGRFCEFGGIGNSQEKRFLINHCQGQCANTLGKGFSPYLEGILYQRQNALYTTVHKESLYRLAKEHSNIAAVVSSDMKKPVSASGKRAGKR